MSGSGGRSVDQPRFRRNYFLSVCFPRLSLGKRSVEQPPALGRDLSRGYKIRSNEFKRKIEILFKDLKKEEELEQRD